LPVISADRLIARGLFLIDSSAFLVTPATTSDLCERLFDAGWRHRELEKLSTAGVVNSGRNDAPHANDGRLSTTLGREICVFDENRFDFRQP
jgi:hypothetical protein